MKQLITLFLLCATPAFADFPAFIEDLKQEARQKGLDATIITDAFNGDYKMVERAITRKQNQPEAKFSFQRYTTSLVSPERVGKGRVKFAEQAETLQTLEKTYGIPAAILTSLWGVESHYGQHKGRFNIIPSLATLAYDSHRKPFFRRELFAAIQIIQEGHVALPQFQGSWAGAMGQVQFIPTSFLNYAVDANDDGKKDLWQTEADILASAANYLKQNGWRQNQPVAQRVILSQYLPANLTVNRQHLTAKKPVSEWQNLGLRHLNREPFPSGNTLARLYLPDGPSGFAFLVYHNFDVIMRWNNSSVFAYTVHKLAQEISS